MTFAQWLDTYVDEKGLDRDHLFEKEGPEWGLNLIQLDVLLDTIKAAPAPEQVQIRTILTRIDFINGDPMHFFDHLAGAIAL